MRAASLAALLALAACAGAPERDYTKLVAADPRSILVVPVVNRSVDVDAAEYLLSTLPVPLAERGYYVFPVNVVKRLLEDDGLSDAAMVHQADPVRLCGIFGADAVLFTTIEQWTAKYALVVTRVEVEVSYLLKDGRTGDVLWTGREKGVYQTDSSQGLLVAVIAAAVEKASPNYMPMARRANAKAMEYPGPGFPAGPYRPEYRKDLPGVQPASAAPPR